MVTNEAGNIQRASAHVVQVQGFGAGIYTVLFTEPVNQCGYVGTLDAAGAPGLILAASHSDPLKVSVRTYAMSGGGENRAWSLAVFC